MIAILGSLGLALVWGWLLVLPKLHVPRSLRRVIGMTAGTGLVSCEVVALAGLQQLLVLFLGALGGCLLHLAWQRQLRRLFRGASPRTHEEV
jgi:hypothetical protein